VLLAFVAQWQHRFLKPDAVIDHTYRVTASTGINREQKFFFYLYHLNLFPLATDATIKADTNNEAERLLRASPELLRQDEGSTFRAGERGRTYLYFIDAWLTKNALTPSLKPANGLAFTFALCSLLVAFWSQRRTWQGLLLVFLLGSNPLQLYLVYVQENVFSWPITSMILLLAVHVPLLANTLRGRIAQYYPWIAAIGSGVIIAAIRNIRSEPSVMIASIIAVYATMTWIQKRKRVGLVFALIATIWVGNKASTAFMDHKLAEARKVVTNVGGQPYNGPLVMYHTGEIWHVVFCGLGDFDIKHGYKWDDHTAIVYATPQLQKMHPDITIEPRVIQSRFYDPAKRHPVFIGEIAGYNDIVKAKVLGDIKADPLWYADILDSRLWRILMETTPVGFAGSQRTFYIQGSLCGILWLAVTVFTAYARRWFLLKLLVFSLPLSLTALLIYSGGGTPFYSTFHVFGAFAAVLLAVEGAGVMLKKRHLRSRPIP
jgi:hypothetical protein